MSKKIRIAALSTVTIIVVIIAAQPFIPAVQEKYSELGILGPGMTTRDYPRVVIVNQTFLLYGLVANHEGGIQYYQVLAKLGNQSTLVSNATFANAPLVQSYSRVIVDEGTWLFPMNLTVNHTTANARFIFELWTFAPSGSTFAYTGLWDQLWVNATLA